MPTPNRPTTRAPTGQRSSSASEPIGIRIEELEDLLSIDENTLEACCREQPVLFYKVSKELTRAQSLRDQASQDLKDIEARVDAEIRNEPLDEGEKKPTENAIANRVRMHPSVIALRDKLQIRNEAYGTLAALKESFGQRSYMLRELVQLWLANYYSDIEAKDSWRDMTRHRADDIKARHAEERRRRE